MRIYRSLLFLLCLALDPLISRSLSAAELVTLSRHALYDSYFSGDLKAVPTNPLTSGGLMLMGGSDDVDEAFRWFIRKAGGGKVLILRASGDDDYHPYLREQLGGVACVETLVFRSREASFTPAVAESIKSAQGIFLAGGDQALYLRFWRGTPVQSLLQEHVAAGRPLGGTSAGLAVLGQHVYGCLDGISLQSSTALNNPLGPESTLVSDFLRLPCLEGVITDSHFSARKRLGRLIVFILRLQDLPHADPVLGIGVDEKTALCVEPDGQAQVYTQADGQVWFVRSSQPPSHWELGHPLSVSTVSIETAGPESTCRLAPYQMQRPRGRYQAAVIEGHLKLEATP